VGLLGSGHNALNVLECLKAVRPIERVEVYSPTREHRIAFAAEATSTLGIPVTPHNSAAEVTQGVDIIAVATNSRVPVLSFSDLRPGVHVTAMGVTTELDASVYLEVDQFVTPSRSQEIANAEPGPPPHHMGGGGPLYPLVQQGRLKREAIVELGSIIKGEVAPRNGPSDIALFRDSRGGVGDLALANYAYEYAHSHGLGIEVDL
jgi:ornithine cyclodeaminase/alanine dehydrogenase-like protein (mu-crystallin family)